MAKKGLGRGLEALMGDLSDKKSDQDRNEKPRDLAVPIEYLSPAKDQPRKIFTDKAIDELAASIKQKGVLQPILVRPHKEAKREYEIVAGERRWRAAQKAGLHEVPVIIRDLNNEEAAEIALVENIQRVDLNPMEEADAYNHLIKHHNRSAGEIAKALGKSRSHIANLLRLRDLPAEVKQLVRDEKLTMGHARALLGTENPVALAKEIVAKGLTVRQTEKLAGRDSSKAQLKQKKNRNSGKGKSTIKDADIRAFERSIEEALGLEVYLDHLGKKGGRLTIHYLTLDQLDDICKRLSGLGV